MIRFARRSGGRFRALTGIAASVLSAAWGCRRSRGRAIGRLLSERPIKILVPYAPGRPRPTSCRIVAAKLTESLARASRGKRPGHRAISLWKPLRKRPRRLHAVLGNVSTHHQREQLSRISSDQAVPRSGGHRQTVEIPHIIATTAVFPPTRSADLIALRKRDPGKITSSAGLGKLPAPRHGKASRRPLRSTLPTFPIGRAGQMIPASSAGEAPVAFLNLS